MFLGKDNMQDGQLEITNWELLSKHFLEERLHQYLIAAKQSRPCAIRLFIWNSKTSAAIWEVIGYVEVSIRTVVDKQLRKENAQGDWLINFNVFTSNDPIWKVVAIARTRVGKTSKMPTHSQILQQLPLGFFQTLLSKRYLRVWPMLAGGFTGGTRSSQKELSAAMFKLRKFRNRVGHHDLLVDDDLVQEFNNILRIAELIDPDFRRWLTKVSDVSGAIDSRPAC